MSASNLTDSVTSLSNSTVNNYVIGPVTTWETRLQANWHPLFIYSIGTILCILIICVSIFSEHITGDYKWFVLNQALANMFFAIGSISYTLVITVWYSQEGYSRLYSDVPPLWVGIYAEVASLLKTKFGLFSTTTTLFATAFNRWMAIVMPHHYQKFMSGRLIVLYCTLCYLITISTDYRLTSKLNIPNTTLINVIIIIPWLLSIILNVATFFKLWNHMRTTTTITDRRRLQESQMVLYSLMIQTAVQFFQKIFLIVILITLSVMVSTGMGLNSSFMSFVNLFGKISSPLEMHSSAITCIVILITMRPYRKAVLSLISPITKFCQQYLKPNVTPTTTDNRVTPKSNVVHVQPNIVNVQPARRANSP